MNTVQYINLERQLRTCRDKIKVSLPENVKQYFPYTLTVKGYKSADNKYWIQMQMYKSQHENPIKRYRWKCDTYVIEAINDLSQRFVKEYIDNHRINNVT